MSKKSVASLAKKPASAECHNLLDRAQVASAVKALVAHHKRAAADSLDLEAEGLTVQLGLKRAPVEPSPNPRRVAVPHAMRADARTACLFVKDADKPWIRDLVTEGIKPGAKGEPVKLDGTKDLKIKKRDTPLREKGDEKMDPDRGLVKVQKVISLSKLRTSYARFSARRELRDSYDVFFADERIVPMLGKVLGSTFFSRKKQPISVKVMRPESLPGQIEKALNSAQVVLKTGTCVSVVVAHTDMTLDEMVGNVYEGCHSLVSQHIPRKWANVQSVSLKLPHSVALPVYVSLPTPSDPDVLAKAAEAAHKLAADKLLKKIDDQENDDDDDVWPLIAVGDNRTAQASDHKEASSNKRRKKDAASSATPPPPPTTKGAKKRDGDDVRTTAASPAAKKKKAKATGGPLETASASEAAPVKPARPVSKPPKRPASADAAPKQQQPQQPKKKKTKKAAA